jgi:phosphonate transport system ATP-binding protein
LNLLVTPTAGEVSSDDLGPLRGTRQIREHRRRTAMIFQQHQLIARRSALDNVMVGGLGHRSTLRSLLPASAADLRRALSCLDRVGLLSKAMERVDRLSGGEQQRVGIARALAQQPQTILADEPVASLDPATAERVMGILRGVCSADGLTAVVSLHQVSFAQRFADRVIGLARGAVLFDGRPGELTEAVLHRIYRASGPAAGPTDVAAVGQILPARPAMPQPV